MQSQAPLTIGIIAGEHSGDILGSALVKSLQKRHPDARFVGIAGPRMKALGVEAIFDMEELAVMGLIEVLGRLPRLLSIRKRIVAYFKDNPPDVFIGIDAPDFNLGVETKLKAAGIKTIQYVSPSVWAWREKRIFNIAKATHRVLALLPFEKAFYDKHQVPCTFVGHTLADDIPLDVDTQAARDKLGLTGEGKVLALMPGSRSGEVGLLSEPYLKTALALKARFPDLRCVVPVVNDARKAQFEAIKASVAHDLPVVIVEGDSATAMQSADAILIASGTATLEAMLYKKPMVVGYKFKPLSYRIFKTFFKFNITHFSLPNLLADAPLVPEFLQDECTEEALTNALLPLLSSENDALIAKFYDIHQAIRKNASERAADAVLEVINE